ncbi:MAG: hypothetical protein ACHQAQ_03320 [Hyphomicrobiales bacterium]
MLKARMRWIIFAILIVAGLFSPGGAGPALSATLASPEDWSGSWHGTYVCAQGVTGLTLAITPSGTRSVTAVFSFYAVPRNPTVPSGEFAMAGRLGAKAGRLALSAVSWTTRPAWYVMVDLDGDYDPRSGEYRGRVHGPGCGLFRLRRDLTS